MYSDSLRYFGLINSKGVLYTYLVINLLSRSLDLYFDPLIEIQ